MRNKQWRVVALAILFVFLPFRAYADSSSSTNYKVDETFFGSGGELNACSGNYCSKQTAGELGVGDTSSANYQAYAGFNTTDEPFIEFVVTSSSVDLGYLDTATATTTTGQFYVRAWQAEGYVVRNEGDLPTNPSGGHQLTGLTSATASSPGTEQFGINLVKNTNFCGSGCDVGADPVQANSFSFGQAETGYDTPAQFKYNKGDIIARSTRSTSVTIYTVSYLFNISDVTPAGSYVFHHVMVATGTY